MPAVADEIEDAIAAEIASLTDPEVPYPAVTRKTMVVREGDRTPRFVIATASSAYEPGMIDADAQWVGIYNVLVTLVRRSDSVDDDATTVKPIVERVRRRLIKPGVLAERCSYINDVNIASDRGPTEGPSTAIKNAESGYDTYPIPLIVETYEPDE